MKLEVIMLLVKEDKNNYQIVSFICGTWITGANELVYKKKKKTLNKCLDLVKSLEFRREKVERITRGVFLVAGWHWNYDDGSGNNDIKI